MFTTVFGLNEGYKVALENDPQLEKAEDLIPQAKALYPTRARSWPSANRADEPPVKTKPHATINQLAHGMATFASRMVLRDRARV